MPVQPQRWRKQAIARMMLVLLNCQGIFDMSQHTQHVCFMYVSFLLAGKMLSVQNQQKKANFVNQMRCRLLKLAPLLLYQQSCQSMSILDFMNIHKLYGICVCLVSSTNVFFLTGKSPKKSGKDNATQNNVDDPSKIPKKLPRYVVVTSTYTNYMSYINYCCFVGLQEKLQKK